MTTPSPSARPLAGVGTEAVGPRELASGIDALYLSGLGTPVDALLMELETLRAEAVETGQGVEWVFGGYPVEVLGSAWGKYRFCLSHELARFGLTASTALPAVRVQPTALALHGLGAEGTVRWVRRVLADAGLDVTLQVGRLDLHSDWQGLAIAADERSSFVTYSDRRALYEVAENLSGLNFGKRGGAVYARIYDKTRELATKGDDWWHDLWGSSYRPSEQVMRVEFEFTRQGLREFDLSSPEEVFDQVGALWAYATGRWLSLRVPLEDSTRTRWPVDARWVAVQRASLAGSALPADRIKAGEARGSLRRLMPALVGYLASAAAAMGTQDVADTLAALPRHLDAYGAATGTWFDQRVEDKRRQR